MKKRIARILKKALHELDIKLKIEEIEKLIETPPSYDLGDYAFPCFSFAEKLKMSPHEIALNLREKIENPAETEFEDIQVSGPYINFFLDRKEIARQLILEVLKKREKFGRSHIGHRKKVVIEFSAPNIAKPFGIGHLRSTIIGNSIANICEFVGFKPIRINYLGDWGTQFGKLIYAYKEFGNEEKLKKDPINYLLSLYVKVNKNKKYDKKAREWFKKLEQRDREAVILWRAFRELSIDEFKKIYDLFGIKFDDYSGEAEALKGKTAERVIKTLKEKQLLKKSKGAQVVSLKKFGLDVALIQKTDGTTLYLTRDLAAAIKRHKKYEFSKMIYEVGQEQTLHFKQLFKILELLGYDWAKDCIHADHGLYLDTDGKKFSTRKGKTVFMQDIIDKTTSLAKKEIEKRFPNINKTELEDRAMKIAIAAIFYGDLKNNRSNNMIFDLQRFVSFEGDTGPYILYSYARASSILEKSKCTKEFKIFDPEPKEIDLIKRLSEFENIVLSAYNNLNPSIIANYCYQLAKTFNEFYHSCQVIDSEEEAFRLALVESFRQILRNALRLLGIKTIEKM